MITDEQLSAFLDSELSEAEMRLIRQQLATDPVLSARLAELASAVTLVSRYGSAIEQVPLSADLQKFLQSTSVSAARRSAPLRLNVWQRLQHVAQQHLALAAGVALLAGLLLGQVLPMFQQPASPPWQTVFALLESKTSGQQYDASQDYQLLPQLTFKDSQQQYCRHFILRDKTTQSENIACRREGHWQLVVSYLTPLPPQAGNDYQLASSAAKLDPLLDQLIAGPLLDVSAEQRLLASNWQ